MEAERRVAVVVGGAGGLGRAAALRLAHDARRIVVADIAETRAEVAAEIQAEGGSATALELDIAQPESIKRMVSAVVTDFGRLDILVNAAGVLGPNVSLVETTDRAWRMIIDINLSGVFLCCRHAIPVMVERGWGRIVTISSRARRGSPGYLPYGVAKAGLVALTKTIAMEYAAEGVLVNCVEPGRALTTMVTSRFSAEHLAKPPDIPIGRYADPSEVAEVIAFLCSESCTYVTGAVYEVTGGAI